MVSKCHRNFRKSAEDYEMKFFSFWIFLAFFVMCMSVSGPSLLIEATTSCVIILQVHKTKCREGTAQSKSAQASGGDIRKDASWLILCFQTVVFL